jgi:hypothetical protein
MIDYYNNGGGQQFFSMLSVQYKLGLGISNNAGEASRKPALNTDKKDLY